MERSAVWRRLFAIALAALVALHALGARAAEPASPADVARFLAGLPPSEASPLSAAAREPAWQQHAGEMNAAWASFEQRHLTRVRVWAAAMLGAPRATMYYMFGGPDFAHADAFFPDASTYVLSGLEPVGPLPEPSKLRGAALSEALAGLRQSLGNFLQYGYFITREMGAQFRSGGLAGTLPVLYLFLARSGKSIRAVEFVALGGDGKAVPVRRGRKPQGVRISFSGPDGRARTLYYFSTDLANSAVRRSGFLSFCAALGTGDSLIKSASYLMHLDNFSNVREFLLGHSATLVQDDSGIPLRHFEPGRWRLRPFGRYAGPTEEFKRFHQADLAQLYRFGAAQPVNFGIGYRWHPERTNILVAERLGDAGRDPR